MIGGLAGTAMFVMSLLFILLAVTAPFINPTMEFATPHMNEVKTYIPTFDFSYFTTVSMLVFAVGGAEKFLHMSIQHVTLQKNFQRDDLFSGNGRCMCGLRFSSDGDALLPVTISLKI